eukprot:5775635-Alexandrium_andersonii.AAC.1
MAEAARPAGAGRLPAVLPPAPTAPAPCCPPSVGPGGGWTPRPPGSVPRPARTPPVRERRQQPACSSR